jgi:hypothetical protein
MFTITTSEPSLVTGDILTYRCEAHQVLYDDLRIIYNDGSSTYERNLLDRTWHSKGNRQSPQPAIDWNSSTKPSTGIQTMAIEVKTRQLTKSKKHGYFQCIAQSKRLNIIPNAEDTYTISVGGKFRS